MQESVDAILNRPFKEIREWLKIAPLEAIEEFIDKCSPAQSIYTRAINERSKRYAKLARKPHWTVTPAFIIAVLGMIFAAIAAWPTIKDWLHL